MNSRTLTIITVPILLLSAVWLYAGPLNPPAGPITSTYKTLTEVEPRVAISLTNTPGDANSLFKITQPGSYYLTGNVTGVAAKHGIEIAVAANGPSVTIDLMGFELAGVPGSLDGISVTATGTRNVAVHNGTVRAWGGDGIDVLNSTNNLLEDLRVEGNGGRGILAGAASTLTGCTAYSNTGIGISANVGNTVTGCTANSNGGTGISTNSGSTVTGCTALSNGGDGIRASAGGTVTGCTASFNTADGINAGGGSTVTGCTASSNGGNGISTSAGSTVTGCTASSNTGDGISTASSSTVTGCTASTNTGDGIEVTNDCRVTDNTCDSNGIGDGAGIHATSSDNRIEGNNCTDADRGIDVDLAGNIIIKNTCSGNVINWTIAANNVCGPILDRTVPASAAISGNSAPDSTLSTHPHANFTY